MAKILNAPKTIGEVPRYNRDITNLFKQEADWQEKLRQHVVAEAKAAGTFDAHLGEVIQFQVADNYARYMVASMKPLALVHLPFGDGYTFQFANRLTAKDVRDKVEEARRWAAMLERAASANAQK